jgi:hypothetical protein
MILRSSIGLYAAQMPNRLVMASTYLLYLWVGASYFLLFLFLLLSLTLQSSTNFGRVLPLVSTTCVLLQPCFGG